MYVPIAYKLSFFNRGAKMATNEPKYQRVKEHIIEYIISNNLKYNDPIKSEIELMKEFNVSRHTIRKSIGDLVNEGWLYKHQGRGTFVANTKPKAPGKGKLIGVITTYIKDYIFPEIISGIEDILSEQGYSILLGNTNNDIEKERAILKNMLKHNLSGLIVEPTKSIFPNHNQDLFLRLQSQGVPILFIHATYQNVNASYVIEDDQKAGYLATKCLIENGHERIAGIFKQDDMQGHGRYSGYLQALREASLDPVEGDVLWYTTENKEQLMDVHNINAIERLIDGCSALVCYNDQISIGVIQLLNQMGKTVPEDMSLVSFDNSDMANKGAVKLTTIAHPKAILGETAAKHMLKLIQKEETMIHDIIEPELIQKNSVLPFKK